MLNRVTAVSYQSQRIGTLDHAMFVRLLHGFCILDKENYASQWTSLFQGSPYPLCSNEIENCKTEY